MLTNKISILQYMHPAIILACMIYLSVDCWEPGKQKFPYPFYE